MIEALERKGADKDSLIAKIVGGANMFRGSKSFVNNIGPTNAMAIKTILDYERITIAGEDVGGEQGRSVKFYTADGKASVRSSEGKKEI